MLVLLFALYTCVFLYYFNTLCCKDISHMNSVPFDDDFKCFLKMLGTVPYIAQF